MRTHTHPEVVRSWSKVTRGELAHTRRSCGAGAVIERGELTHTRRSCGAGAGIERGWLRKQASWSGSAHTQKATRSFRMDATCSDHLRRTILHRDVVRRYQPRVRTLYGMSLDATTVKRIGLSAEDLGWTGLHRTWWGAWRGGANMA